MVSDFLVLVLVRLNLLLLLSVICSVMGDLFGLMSVVGRVLY